METIGESGESGDRLQGHWSTFERNERKKKGGDAVNKDEGNGEVAKRHTTPKPEQSETR